MFMIILFPQMYQWPQVDPCEGDHIHMKLWCRNTMGGSICLWPQLQFKITTQPEATYIWYGNTMYFAGAIVHNSAEKKQPLSALHWICAAPCNRRSDIISDVEDD